MNQPREREKVFIVPLIYETVIKCVFCRFVRIQAENGWRVSEECYLIEEDETEEAEDIEVPKALGDIFESVAGTLLSALCPPLHLAPCAREYLPRLRPEPGRCVDSLLPDDEGGDRPLLQPRPQVPHQVGI